MLKIHEIREIIKLIDQSGISHFELESEGDKLSIRKETTQVSTPKELNEDTRQQTFIESIVDVQKVETVTTPLVKQSPIPPVKQNESVEEDESLHKITSPMVGTFYEASTPGAKPFVNVGDQVEKNTTVCIVEAMKLFNEIEAEVRGRIVKVLVENGQLVEYGQPLFLVKPE